MPVKSQKVRIVTDSTADIPDELAQSLSIVVVPCNIHFGEAVYRDRVDISPEEFYRRLTTLDILPTTSQPSPSVFQEVYSRLIQEGYQVLSIHVAAALSGTHNSAMLAVKEMPPDAVRVVDSQTLSMALGWLAIAAAEGSREGKDLDELEELVGTLIPRVRLLAYLDRLDFLEKGGRIGKLQFWLGSMLSIKPIFEIRYGSIEPLERVRTKSRAIQRLAELVTGLGEVERLAVGHLHAKEDALHLAGLLRPSWPSLQPLTYDVGPVLGAHGGPGALGVAVQLRG